MLCTSVLSASHHGTDVRRRPGPGEGRLDPVQAAEITRAITVRPPTFRQQVGRDMDIKSKWETTAEIQEGVSLALTFPPRVKMR